VNFALRGRHSDQSAQSRTRIGLHTNEGLHPIAHHRDGSDVARPRESHLSAYATTVTIKRSGLYAALAPGRDGDLRGGHADGRERARWKERRLVFLDWLVSNGVALVGAVA
jgi:hypothetical protein